MHNNIRYILKSLEGGNTPSKFKKFAKKNESAFNVGGKALDFVRNIAFANLLDSGLTSGISNTYDAVSNSLMAFTPVGTLIGGAMKAGAFTGDGLQALGGGTDQMTTTDLIMDSSLFSWNVGLINGFGGKRTDKFLANRNTIELVGGSYGGTVGDIENAVSKANKKFGMFSKGARNKANRLIADARMKLNIMTDITDLVEDQRAMLNDLNYIRYNTNLNGGFSLKYLRAAKSGIKLLDKIDFVKQRRLIHNNINLNTKQIEEFKEGGNLPELWEPIIEDLWEPIIEIPEFLGGGKLEKSSFEDWFNSIPENNRDNQYDYKKAYEVFDWEILSKHAEDPENNHLYSVSPIADKNGNYPFLKLGKIENNPEIQGEFDWYNSEEGKEHKSKFDIEYINDRYYYVPKKFKEGGKTKEELETPEIEETNQKNLIPEGALHKNKHHIEHTEGLTLKGIPVIDNEGEQLAEIELNEIIFTLEVTKKLEELYKEGTDEAAIEAGKLLVKEILFNTDDRTNLIAKCLEGGKL